jgi:hypothetical protein
MSMVVGLKSRLDLPYKKTDPAKRTFPPIYAELSDILLVFLGLKSDWLELRLSPALRST